MNGSVGYCDPSGKRLGLIDSKNDNIKIGYLCCLMLRLTVTQMCLLIHALCDVVS